MSRRSRKENSKIALELQDKEYSIKKAEEILNSNSGPREESSKEESDRSDKDESDGSGSDMMTDENYEETTDKNATNDDSGSDMTEENSKYTTFTNTTDATNATVAYFADHTKTNALQREMENTMIRRITTFQNNLKEGDVNDKKVNEYLALLIQIHDQIQDIRDSNVKLLGEELLQNLKRKNDTHSGPITKLKIKVGMVCGQAVDRKNSVVKWPIHKRFINDWPSIDLTKVVSFIDERNGNLIKDIPERILKRQSDDFHAFTKCTSAEDAHDKITTAKLIEKNELENIQELINSRGC